MMLCPSGSASFSQSARSPAASTLPSGSRRQKILSSRPVYMPITAHIWWLWGEIVIRGPQMTLRIVRSPEWFGGVGLQIIRDWVLRFNARGPDGLLDGKSTGQPSKLNDTQRQAIAGMIESGPIPAVHGVVRWRLIDLAQWIFEEFRITIAKQTLSRELRVMGYRKLSARPRHHAQAEGAIEDFKKTSPRAWRQLRARRRLTATR